MMYEGIRGALAALKGQGEEPRFRVRETPIGRSMPLISMRKCSSAGLCSRSSIGQKIREHYPGFRHLEG
jgi:hypothetical protein